MSNQDSFELPVTPCTKVANLIKKKYLICNGNNYLLLQYAYSIKSPLDSMLIFLSALALSFLHIFIQIIDTHNSWL